MTLSTEQIRDLCTSEVFDRARKYRNEERIERIDRFDETVNAAVQGSQPEPYEVEIQFMDGAMEPENVDATCTYPYDWGGYCKHIIAVLLELTEGDINLEDGLVLVLLEKPHHVRVVDIGRRPGVDHPVFGLGLFDEILDQVECFLMLVRINRE